MGSTCITFQLIPVIDPLRARFPIARVCVADRGLISTEMMAELEGAACCTFSVRACARKYRLCR
jgi:hypothetical protein